MMKILKVIAVALIISAGGLCLAQNVSSAFLPDNEEGYGRYVYKKDLTPRSQFSSKLERNTDGTYTFTQTGSGDYSKYQDITWESLAIMRVQDGVLSPIYTRRIIKDKQGKPIVTFEKNFDYAAKAVRYKASLADGKVVTESFPIKGNTTDEILLTFFLKSFAARQGQEQYRNFFLVTSEPKFYRINLQFFDSQDMDTAWGRVKAIKMRLIPQLGWLTGLAKAVVPPTYVWYTAQPPYIWLKYEGLECGLGSTHIVVYPTGGASAGAEAISR